MLFEELSKQLSYKIFPQKRLSLASLKQASKQQLPNAAAQLLFPKEQLPKAKLP
jgi:hypothetical protein